MTKTHLADIVLEGGGVKGLGLVGAITALEAQGYQFNRVAGTSAGAVVGSLLAAGLGVDAMVKTMQNLDYTKFQDKNWLDQLGPVGELASLLMLKGIYRGEYLHRWLSDELVSLGVRTFADLRLDTPEAQELPKAQRYKLTVIVSDVSRGELVRLPWDYHKYGLDPDEQLVADAVRASMSIPFFYIPVRLRRSWLVDGGFLSDFPISLFDRPDGLVPRWPTFGVKLSAKPQPGATINPVHSTWGLAKALFSTMQGAHDRMHLDDPSGLRRTMFVDSSVVNPTDFGITRSQQQQLFENGQTAAKKFLDNWDFASYKHDCRGV